MHPWKVFVFAVKMRQSPARERLQLNELHGPDSRPEDFDVQQCFRNPKTNVGTTSVRAVAFFSRGWLGRMESTFKWSSRSESPTLPYSYKVIAGFPPLQTQPTNVLLPILKKALALPPP